MISKLGVGILLTVATLFFATPTNVIAATSSGNAAKIKKYFKQLKALPNRATPAAKVSSLVTKLSRLDPKKAAKYYKIGLTKLGYAGGTAAASATKIAALVAKILKKSGLPASQIQKFTQQVKNADLDYVPPTPSPTPTSPSAMLLPAYCGHLA